MDAYSARSPQCVRNAPELYAKKACMNKQAPDVELSPDAQEAAAAAAYSSVAGRQQQPMLHSQLAAPSMTSLMGNAAANAPGSLQLPGVDQVSPTDARYAAAAAASPPVGVSLGPDGGRPASPVPLNHYLQNMISPRSRAEYDEFNRFHFSKLQQYGRMDPRMVTPKVGEDPLNRAEVADLRSELRSPVVAAEMAARARSPGLLCPTGKLDHVTNILTLEKPGDAVPQDPLVPVHFPEQDADLLDNKPMRAPGASYDWASRDHVYNQGLL